MNKMILMNEVKHYFLMTLIWSLVLGALLAMVIGMFPVMAQDMSSIVGMINNLGPFGQALKIDGLQINKLIGFYGMEMENMLGIGGAFFAGYLGGKILAKEEGGHTAEFLLTHPILRVRIYLEKMLALILILLVFNLIITTIAYFSIVFTGQVVPLAEFLQMHFAMFLVQVSLAWLTLGISAFLKADSIGISMGIVFILFFVNIFINLYSKLNFLSFLTPFQFSYASDILKDGINYNLVAIVMGWMFLVMVIGGMYYQQKDIQA